MDRKVYRRSITYKYQMMPWIFAFGRPNRRLRRCSFDEPRLFTACYDPLLQAKHGVIALMAVYPLRQCRRSVVRAQRGSSSVRSMESTGPLHLMRRLLASLAEMRLSAGLQNGRGDYLYVLKLELLRRMNAKLSKQLAGTDRLCSTRL